MNNEESNAFHYYVTYSVRIIGGHITGRIRMTLTFPMETWEDIVRVEQYILDLTRKEHPTAGDLYLTWWQRISP